MLVSTQKSTIGIIHNLGITLFAVFVSLFLVGSPAMAQEAETEKKPLKLGSAKKTSSSKGLAGYASTIKLKKSEDTTISNSSLKSSNKGTLSIGGGVTTGVQSNTAVGPGAIGGESSSETWNKDYEGQQKKIADMEKNLAENAKRQGSQTDPYLVSPQNRPPGVASHYDNEKAKATKELEAERKRLEKMRREARRDGVDLPRK